MICRTCRKYYAKHAMVCPRCHTRYGLASMFLDHVKAGKAVAVEREPAPGDSVTLDGEEFFVLERNQAPTGEPIALIEPVDGGESEWVYADDWR